ncbi:ornithine cyclodeaminase family protein [Dapis sp. BLCC M126]|uniref:ornithine cyclodeaminase family protein n=1 Tax=Dapis sp. BLCC M126 TaxID=3400189 RepID=UPI003CF88B29
METLILSVNDIRKIVQKVGLDMLMDEMIARLIKTFQTFDPNKTIIPPREGFNYENPHTGLIEWMPSLAQKEGVVIKVVGYHPTNPNTRQLPTIVSTVSAYDTTSGHLIGLMDATFITALRTGAASAVASQLMAIPNSKIIGLIGCGAQAVSQLHALSRIFDFEQVLIYDIDSAASNSFETRVSCLNLKNVEVKETPLEKLVTLADILCTATSVKIGEGPVFQDNSLKPWIHINAVGSDFPGKTELPQSLLQKSFVCPDFRTQALKEGECQQLNPEDIKLELYQLIQKQEQYRDIQDRQTVFDSTGWALEDRVAMNIFLDYAQELDVGTLVQLESISADFRNPYDFSISVESKREQTQLFPVSR